MAKKSNSIATNAREMRELAKTLDNAIEIPLEYTYGGARKVAQFNKMIYNTTKDKESSVTSDQYKLILHTDAINHLADCLEEYGEEFKFTVDNHGDVVGCNIEFLGKNFHVEDNSKEGVNTGGRFLNSYNKSQAFKGWGWMLRLICTNGAYGRSVIPEASFYRIHMGDLDEVIPELISNFLNTMEDNVKAYQDVIDGAMDETIEFKSLTQLTEAIDSVVHGKVHTERIVNFLDPAVKESLKPTKYDIFNGFTAYASHFRDNKGNGLSEPVANVIQAYGEKVLKPGFQFKTLQVKAEA